ncbi:unnamed protein product [Victoria cruziana]
MPVTQPSLPSSSSQRQQDAHPITNEGCESRLYIGNLDQRITESQVIKMFSPYGKIISEDFLWHRHGPRRGEPRGFAFIQFSTREEAQLAMEKMDGRLACGRPLVVRFAGGKTTADASKPSKGADDLKKSGTFGCSTAHMSRSSKIAAIKNKLKSMEEETCSSAKKPRQASTSKID